MFFANKFVDDSVAGVSDCNRVGEKTNVCRLISVAGSRCSTSRGTLALHESSTGLGGGSYTCSFVLGRAFFYNDEDVRGCAPAQNDSYLSRTDTRITRIIFHTCRAITFGQTRHHPVWQLSRPINSKIAFIQKHKHILNSILQYTCTPFHLDEKKLGLERASCLNRNASVIGGYTMSHHKFALNQGLKRRLS